MNEKQFREKLTSKQYRIMRQKGTEQPFTGRYVHKGEDGIYMCAACKSPLFDSDAQFDSGTGWPSFDKAIEGSVQYQDDHGATEIICARCGSHLGHVFDDGPTKTGKRYCINSVCLDLKAKKKAP